MKKSEKTDTRGANHWN